MEKLHAHFQFIKDPVHRSLFSIWMKITVFLVSFTFPPLSPGLILHRSYDVWKSVLVLIHLCVYHVCLCITQCVGFYVPGMVGIAPQLVIEKTQNLAVNDLLFVCNTCHSIVEPAVDFRELRQGGEFYQRIVRDLGKIEVNKNYKFSDLGKSQNSGCTWYWYFYSS